VVRGGALMVRANTKSRLSRAPADLREPWQIEQAKACGCRGTDDLCPCQNESPWPRPPAHHSVCIIPNCGKTCAAHEPFCTNHRDDSLTPEEAWQDLVERDDRTSPSEYPDMALISFE